MTKIMIAPSILAADFANLGEEVRKTEAAGAEILHLDIMDGHFVPNISYGAALIAGLREHSKMLFDAHLMISDPRSYLKAFKDAGVESITIHFEAAENEREIMDILLEIKSMGMRAGLSVKPATPVEVFDPFLDILDMALIMTVEPGFGGQSFMESQLDKVRYLRQKAPQLWIQVDGGITKETAPLVIAAGGNVLVAGTAVYKADDYKKAIDELRG